jgi:hypothetical protein
MKHKVKRAQSRTANDRKYDREVAVLHLEEAMKKMHIARKLYDEATMEVSVAARLVRNAE